MGAVERAAPPAGGFGERVADAQRQLAEAVARAGLKADAYHHVVESTSTVIGLFPELVERLEATRKPLRDDELRAALGGALRAHAGAMVKSLSWGVRLAAAGLLVAVGAVCGGGGYYLGTSQYVHVPAELGMALTGSNAAQWATLMRLNDIGRAQRSCSAQAGGVACSISLWTQSPAARGN